MIRSSVTVSLVEQARGGPFVFWDGFEHACNVAAELGFHGIEVFPESAEQLNPQEVRRVLEDTGLELAAVGTGAGWVCKNLTLTAADATERKQALDFVKRIIDFAGGFGAPAIIGSMQGRSSAAVDRASGLQYLGESLAGLGSHAANYDVPVLYEPLNRYETDLCNTLADGAALLGEDCRNVKLLADLFHMNIEETNVADALREYGKLVGHIHFVDSNRRAVGLGHTDFAPIADAIRDIDFDGFASAEAFPYADSHEAARRTQDGFVKWLAQ